ncbi:MAG: PEP-CTERM sorting domain-containing protein [Phycisphaeraceae bacterium]|nr:MAG: PEP-CTERM sorting domain-containing protein [Phycisphaeraceae bacterium]
MNRLSVVIVLAAGLAATASADLVAHNGAGIPSLNNGGFGNRDIQGTAGVASAIFGPWGGQYIGGPQTVNAPGSVLLDTDLLFTVGPSVDLGGGLRQVSMVWTSITGAPMTNVAPGPVTDLSFELGMNNAPADQLDDPDFIAVVSGTGRLISSTLGLLATSPNGLFTTDGIGGFTGLIFWNAGGADLRQFNINRYEVDIVYSVVPAPGSLGLLGLAGLAAARRRR